MPLPSPNSPLMLDDGTSLPPSSIQTFARIEIPSNTAAQRLVSNTNRKLADLPALPEQMNSFAAILVYTASGLSDSEISIALGLKATQIKRMREHSTYQQLESYMIDAVREQSKQNVVSILAEKEIKAAERVGELVDSLDEKVALAASKDILDRRGHAPKQQVDVRAEMMNTFRIEVVDKRDAKSIIDVEND
jgi:hypothetical protein